MSKLLFILKIVKDRWIRPYDDIVLRFNTKAQPGDPLIWRVFINGEEHKASSFTISGYVYDVCTEENGVAKHNVGCKGRVRWDGSKADILASKPTADILL